MKSADSWAFSPAIASVRMKFRQGKLAKPCVPMARTFVHDWQVELCLVAFFYSQAKAAAKANKACA